MKKSVVVHLITNDNQAQLHFNRRLPRFEAPQYSHPFLSPSTDMIVPRPKARLRLGRYLAKKNASQNPIEIGNPVAAYQHMLDELAEIDGLIHVQQVNTYTLQFVVGKLFNPKKIGRQVAKVISKALFQGRLQFTDVQEDDQTQTKQPSVDPNEEPLISIRHL